MDLVWLNCNSLQKRSILKGLFTLKMMGFFHKELCREETTTKWLALDYEKGERMNLVWT